MMLFMEKLKAEECTFDVFTMGMSKTVSIPAASITTVGKIRSDSTSIFTTVFSTD